MSRSEYTVSTRRAGTLVISTEPSEVAIYKCTLLTDSERRFLIDNLELKSVEFSGTSNCQLFCRCLIHDLAKQFTGQFSGADNIPAVSRGKETILCLHAFSKMTTSWTWLKFAATWFRQGFNVVLLDLPGFGKSSIARDVRCSVDCWQSWEVSLITTLLSNIGVSRVNVVACYESASIFFNIVRHSPHILGRNHVLHNALLNSSELSASNVNTLIKSFLTTGMRRRVFASFDRNRYSNSKEYLDDYPSDVVPRLVLAERFMRQVGKSLGFNQITISAISSMDLAEVCLYDGDQQPGVKPIFGLYPAQAYRVYVSQYLVGASLQDYSPIMAIREAIVTSNEVRQDAPAMVGNSEGTTTSKPTVVPIPKFSYGSRIREMEDQLVLEIAMRESEKEYLQQSTETALKEHQKIAERLRCDHDGEGLDASVIRVRSAAVTHGVLEQLVVHQSHIESTIKQKVGWVQSGVVESELEVNNGDTLTKVEDISGVAGVSPERHGDPDNEPS